MSLRARIADPPEKIHTLLAKALRGLEDIMTGSVNTVVDVGWVNIWDNEEVMGHQVRVRRVDLTAGYMRTLGRIDQLRVAGTIPVAARIIWQALGGNERAVLRDLMFIEYARLQRWDKITERYDYPVTAEQRARLDAVWTPAERQRVRWFGMGGHETDATEFVALLWKLQRKLAVLDL